MRVLCILFASLVLLVQSSHAQTHVRVTRVVDGDTVKVTTATNATLTIRLANIDAPEKKQPGGLESKANLETIALNQPADLYPGVTDRYGRIIGTITVRGFNVAQIQVESGNAWVYQQYCKDLRTWTGYETRARTAHLGIWKFGGPPPTPPWEYRKLKKSKMHTK